MAVLWIVAALVVVLNLPFGFWRATTRPFTVPWVLAVHAPVPLVVGLRFAAGLGWKLVTFPILVGAFFTGQYVGGWIHGWYRRRARR